MKYDGRMISPECREVMADLKHGRLAPHQVTGEPRD